ncbi:MAG TPA: glycosyltransferase family 4 protein [Candidatus Acidoferrales bacterium]|nr:glycosyltransferase family 4 protein [Candidatus Acidoferrales bacterium]
MVIGLFTELLSPGGIQRVGKHVGAVLAAFARERGMSYRFLSLNDPLGVHSVRVGEDEFTAAGFDRAKLRFVAEAWRASSTDPRMVVGAHPHLAPVAWQVKMQSGRARMLVLAHGIEVWAPLTPHRRWALRRADLVLAPSADTARHLVDQQGVPSDRICEVAWGLDPGFDTKLDDQRNHLPAGFPEGRVILTVGRWAASERYKGVDHLISAVAHLLPAVPDLSLVAVGNGDDRGRLEQLARELAVADRVRFLAGMAQEELMACYAACDVFALPSRGEGFGVVFLEAMAHGKPVVGGNHGGIPEIVEDGVTGFLVSHGDVEQLSRVLEKLITDDRLRCEMGIRARERVRSAYLFEHFKARLSQVIADLCAS